MTGMATLQRFRTVLSLVVAASLFFGYALAQDAGQEQEQAEQDTAAEPAQGTDADGEDASEEGDADGAADAESDPGDPGIDPAFDPDIYDPELDDQTYEGSDDVFVPSEEIPADEPIPFPSDI